MSEVVSGRLETLGLEEVEPGLVVDTHHARRTLRMEDPPWEWDRIRDEDGELTGLIQPISPETRTRDRKGVQDRRRPIMVHPDDPWSEYVHPDEYPLDIDLPWWIEMRLRTWREEGREGVPESERRQFPVRCTTLRTDNTRCWNWAGHPTKVKICASHLSNTREAVTKTPAYARERVLELSLNAVDELEYLLHHADGEAVRLKASTEILDRAGVRGGTELDIKAEVVQADPSAELAGRLRDLAKRAIPDVTEEPDVPKIPQLEQAPADEVVEAELVEEAE